MKEKTILAQNIQTLRQKKRVDTRSPFFYV